MRIALSPLLIVLNPAKCFGNHRNIYQKCSRAGRTIPAKNCRDKHNRFGNRNALAAFGASHYEWAARLIRVLICSESRKEPSLWFHLSRLRAVTLLNRSDKPLVPSFCEGGDTFAVRAQPNKKYTQKKYMKI